MSVLPLPTPVRDRLLHLDALRGFALLGVLLSNIHYWFRAPRGHQNLVVPAWPGAGDLAATWLIRALVDAKFIFIFSMLFGVGLALQSERLHGVARILKRQAGLAVIGALHVVLLWNGDILLPYACLGAMALPLLRCSPQAMRRWALGALALVAVLMLAGPLGKAFGTPTPVPTAGTLREWDADESAFIQALATRYLDPSWWNVTRFRILDYGRILHTSIPGFLVVFLNLLAGAWIWKSGLLRHPERHLAGLRRFATWSLPLGLGLHAIYASKGALKLWGYHQPWAMRRWLPGMVDGSMLAGAFLLSLGLASLLLWLWASGRFRLGLAWFAPLGRMALSAYLMQSLVMTAVFYGWGGGLYNRLGPLAGTCLGLGFYAIQMLLCRHWLDRFQMGPVEWAWRSFTYGSFQPFRRFPAPAPGSAVSVPGPS